MKPSIGRIVVYTNPGDREVLPAIVTGINYDGTVALHVFKRNGQTDLGWVGLTEEKAGSADAMGKWCWPEVAP